MTRSASGLSSVDVALTAASILAVQEPDGGIPWSRGSHADVWNHLEAAMALTVAGHERAARRAFDWVLDRQRPDGSWPMKLVAGEVEDASGETNMSAYLAVALWHHWLVHRDPAFVASCWPAVRRGLDWVASMQLPFGGIAWAQEWLQERDGHRPGRIHQDALLAASSSVYQALRAGVSLADLLDEPQPEWEVTGGRLRHALREHRDLFLDKSTFSMDWYYPVLGGAVRGDEASAVIAARWEEFVVPDLGVRCVSTNPWVTGAETSELVLALEAMGERGRAARLFADIQHLRLADGSYWTGYVYPDEAHWPVEQSTFTAAAVVLAADALDDLTPGADIMRGHTMVPQLVPVALECGCVSPERFSDHLSGRPARSA
jgi:hypothetical protein